MRITQVDPSLCECGCGFLVLGFNRRGAQRFVSGHNTRILIRTPEQNEKLSQSQKLAWTSKRKRLPLGSTYQDVNGYVRVKVVEGKGAWRLQHILVMEESIGRKLYTEEVVHHINGKRDDNRIENLYLCRDRSHHNDIERGLTKLVLSLLEDSIIVFNRETGEYERAS